MDTHIHTRTHATEHPATAEVRPSPSGSICQLAMCLIDVKLRGFDCINSD